MCAAWNDVDRRPCPPGVIGPLGLIRRSDPGFLGRSCRSDASASTIVTGVAMSWRAADAPVRIIRKDHMTKSSHPRSHANGSRRVTPKGTGRRNGASTDALTTMTDPLSADLQVHLSHDRPTIRGSAPMLPPAEHVRDQRPPRPPPPMPVRRTGVRGGR